MARPGSSSRPTADATRRRPGKQRGASRRRFVGRPVLWGLAVGGGAGVRGVLESLREELELARVLAGASGVEGVGPALLRKG